MNRLVLFFVLFFFILVSCTFAGQPVDKAPLAEGVEEFENYTPVEVLGDLQFYQDLWVEANLSGDSRRAGDYLATVMALLSYDICVASYEVSELAKRALLTQNPEGAETSGISVEQEAFSGGVAVLNFKEKMFKRIAASQAFSNKYRLLGDYMELLRRDLDRPGAKMAAIDNAREVDDTGFGAASEK
ncbi:MAG: hypothetical protein GY867_04710 [bacterium]|nr:hypothetical protein [bacterium]